MRLPFELKANKTILLEENAVRLLAELGLDEELAMLVAGSIRRATATHYDSRGRPIKKPLIIVDEPTSALDSESADKVLAFMQTSRTRGRLF